MTKVEFLQGLVKVFGQVSVKNMMSLIFDKYNELSEQEQKEFCSQLAGPNPKEKKKCKYCDDSHEYRELQDKEVDAFVRNDNALEVLMCFYDELHSAKMGYACALAINYCPWCGRKLEEEKPARGLRAQAKIIDEYYAPKEEEEEEEIDWSICYGGSDC